MVDGVIGAVGVPAAELAELELQFKKDFVIILLLLLEGNIVSEKENDIKFVIPR